MASAEGSVARSDLNNAWDDAAQRTRALASLVSDGLIVDEGATYRLP